MAEQETQNTINRPGKTAQAKKPKRKRGIFNKLLILGVVIAIALFAWAEQQRRTTERRLLETEQQLEEIRSSTTQNGQEVANRVLEKVRTHINIPEDPEPTVATIVDIERLRESSPFYEKAENGDHLIITTERAILYDPNNDVVLDVVPVQINQATPSPEVEGDENTPPLNPGESPSPESSLAPEVTESPAPNTPAGQ